MCLDREMCSDIIPWWGRGDVFRCVQEMCSDIIPWWGRGDVFRQGDVF